MLIRRTIAETMPGQLQSLLLRIFHRSELLIYVMENVHHGHHIAGCLPRFDTHKIRGTAFALSKISFKDSVSVAEARWALPQE